MSVRYSFLGKEDAARAAKSGASGAVTWDRMGADQRA